MVALFEQAVAGSGLLSKLAEQVIFVMCRRWR